MTTHLTPAQAQDKGYAAAQRSTDLDAAEARFLRRYGHARLEDWTDGWNMHAIGMTKEERPFTTLGSWSAQDGRSSATVVCPFCRSHLEVYLWSLAGSGKRCDCGARLASFGVASKRVPVNS